MTKYEKYPEYRDSGVEWLGEIPAGWTARQLKSIATINPKSSIEHLSEDSPVSFLPMEALSSKNTFKDISRPLKEVSSGYSYFAEGDVVLAKVTPCFENGKAAVMNKIHNGVGFGTTEIHTIRPKEKLLNKNFLYYMLLINSFKSYGISNLRGIGGLRRVPAEIIESFKFPLPSLETQNQIISFLDAETKKIDASVASMESLISLLTEKQTALISETVTRGIPGEHTEFKDSGVEWLGEIAISYNLVNTGRVLKTKKELVGNMHDSFQLLSLTKKGVISRDINSGVGKFPESFDTYQVLYSGNLVFCLFDTEETPRTIGLAKQKGMITGAYTRFEVNPKLANQEFLEKYFIAIDDKKGFKPLYTGLRKTIQKPRFLSSKIALPNLEEQHRIVRFLSEETRKIDKIIQATKKSIELLKEKRQVLISDVVTGKIDVRNYTP